MENSKLSTKISYKERMFPVTTLFNIILANAIRQGEKKMYTDSQTVPTLQPCHRWYDHPSRKSERTDKYTPEAKWQQQGCSIQGQYTVAYLHTNNEQDNLKWKTQYNLC